MPPDACIETGPEPVFVPVRDVVRSPTRAAATLVGVSTVVEAAAVGAILSLTVLTRLPNLQTIPAFTDEVGEVAVGLAILRESARPLTNVDPYIGPFWNYLLAAVFWIFGPSAAAPRLVVLTSGALTVMLTYALGRALFGVRVGLLGATLLGASPVHTAVNSHVAWSNCITPFFTTAGLLVLVSALRDERPRLLPAAGTLFGLAFHTHPTAFPVLAGSALAVLLQRGRWLLGPWPYVAMLTAAIVNANLLVYNLLTGGRTVTYAREIQESYVRETGGEAGYLANLASLIVGLARGLGGILERRPVMSDYLSEPSLWLGVGLAALGLLLALRRRSFLPPLVVCVTVGLLPIINPKYDPILNGRYLAPILPLGLPWLALALDWLTRLRTTVPRAAGRLQPVYSLGVSAGPIVAAVVTIMLLTAWSRALDRYYDDVRENARTGERILEVVRAAKVLGPTAHPVVLDERLDRMALGPGAGIVLRVLATMLALEGIETRVIWLGEERPGDVREGQLVVLAARSKPRFTAEAVQGLGLRAIGGGPPRVHSQSSLYGPYRFGPPSVDGTRPVHSPSGGQQVERRRSRGR